MNISFCDEESKKTEITLTGDGIQVVTNAIKIAHQYGHEYISTEHLLLGILYSPSIIINSAFKQPKLLFERVLSSVVITPGRGGVPGPLPFTPWSKKVLILAEQYARERKREGVSSLDILIGLLSEPGSGAHENLKEEVFIDRLIE